MSQGKLRWPSCSRSGVRDWSNKVKLSLTKDIFRYLCRVQMYLLNFWEIVQFWPAKPRHYYYKGEQLKSISNIKGGESSISTIAVSVSAHHPVETGGRIHHPRHQRGRDHTAAIWLLSTLNAIIVGWKFHIWSNGERLWLSRISFLKRHAGQIRSPSFNVFLFIKIIKTSWRLI